MTKYSRRKVTNVIGDKLLAGESSTDVMKHLAAYLLQHRLSKQAELYVRDIESYLSQNGLTLVSVTTAEPLNGQLSKQIAGLLGLPADKLQIRQNIDKSVIGGVKLETPTSFLDATVAERLRKLRTS